MGRPTKWRRIENVPTTAYFVPSNEAIDKAPTNTLKLEELEAIRLKDLEGLEQEECAENMGVSRPTFQRILLSAREKIADSLINGKIINIEGGNFTINICPVKCMDCEKEWTDSYEKLEGINNDKYFCPECNSNKIICIQGCKGKYCPDNCWCQVRRKKELP